MIPAFNYLNEIWMWIFFNYNKLNQIPGHLSVYHAVDEGSEHYINRFLVPKHLGVKVGCPVMLIKNVSDVLLYMRNLLM
jgi:hypothetical protein